MQLTLDLFDNPPRYGGSEHAFQTLMMRLAVDAGWKVGRVTPFESRGLPDIVILGQGRLMFVEFKLDDGYVSMEQRMALKWLGSQAIEAKVVTPKTACMFMRDIGVAQEHMDRWNEGMMNAAPRAMNAPCITIGSPPFGYRVATVNGERRYVECPSQGAVVRLIFRMASNGHSQRAIAKVINAGPPIRSRSDDDKFIAPKWNHGRVNKILNARCYTGYKCVKWGLQTLEWTDAYPRLDGKRQELEQMQDGWGGGS